MPTGSAPSEALARLVSAVAVAIAVTLSLSLPGLFVWSAYHNADAEMRSEAAVSASLLSEFVTRNPENWRLERQRLGLMIGIAAREGVPETWLLQDESGATLAEASAPLFWPVQRHSEAVMDGGAVVARVIVARSMRGMLIDASGLGLFSVLLSLGAYLALQRLPMRLLRQALNHAAHLGLHDPLTNLPNRALFTDRLIQALATARRERRSLALLCLDLDRFKHVNDTLGHSAGDALLRMAADRMRALLRDDDTLARLGGDEFAVVLTDGSGVGASRPSRSPEAIARRLIDAIADEFVVEGNSVAVGVSIGIAEWVPTDLGIGEETAARLLRQADAALYRAKATGRGTYRLFDPQMDADMRRRNHIERDLREALTAGNQFRLMYQPQVDLITGACVGAEALLRWRHPTDNEIAPDTFIPIAEESGLIVDIGAWVLRTACEEAVYWPSGIRVAVNVSPIQLRRGGMEPMVTKAIAESGLDPDRLELEITETALVSDSKDVLDELARLHALGVSLAMDDFGTGYSGLWQLKRSKFQRIKIDKFFVQSLGAEIQGDAIVRAIVGIGQALGIAVIAEGVETARQASLLREAGCAEAQGYHYGPAMDAAEFRRLAQRTRSVGDSAQADAPPAIAVRARV